MTAVVVTTLGLYWYLQSRHGWRSIWADLRGRTCTSAPAVVNGVVGAIGNTPLIRINSLSEATGCEVGGQDMLTLRI